jgi:hypothetical protein
LEIALEKNCEERVRLLAEFATLFKKHNNDLEAANPDGAPQPKQQKTAGRQKGEAAAAVPSGSA